MWKAVLASVVAAGLVFCTADTFISDGVWTINSLEMCDNPEQYPFEFEVRKRKVNRTHDGFSLTAQLSDEITAEGFGIFMESYTKCDGGYKFSQNLADESFCGLLNKYVQSDLEKILTIAGIDPPNCPIPKGSIEVNDFVIDYTQMPKQAKVGEQKTLVYLTRKGERVACIILYTTFKQEENEGDDDE